MHHVIRRCNNYDHVIIWPCNMQQYDHVIICHVIRSANYDHVIRRCNNYDHVIIWPSN